MHTPFAARRCPTRPRPARTPRAATPTTPAPLAALAALMAAAAMAATAAVPACLHAQAPLTVEMRGGAFLPVAGFRTGPERGGQLAAGPSFGVGMALERTGGWHLYLGFSQHRLDCTDDGCTGDGEYVSTSWELGARLDLGSGTAVPWIRLGLTTPRVERDRPEPAAADVTALGFGGEAGFGVRVPVAGRFHASPGVRFGAVDSGLPGGGELRLRYVVAELAVVVGF